MTDHLPEPPKLNELLNPGDPDQVAIAGTRLKHAQTLTVGTTIIDGDPESGTRRKISSVVMLGDRVGARYTDGGHTWWTPGAKVRILLDDNGRPTQ
jgi:hypothetical protein